MGFFNGSAEAVDGAGGVGFGAIVCWLHFANSSSLNRILSVFVLHLWDKLGGGPPHSFRSLFHRLRADRLCHMLRPASRKKTSAAPQSRGVSSILQMSPERASSTSADNDKGVLR